MKTPTLERSINSGVQKVYKYANNQGASVVRGPFTYGSREGKWELAVLRLRNDEREWQIDYTTPLTDDVLGYLTEAEVDDLLAKIEALPQVEKL